MKLQILLLACAACLLASASGATVRTNPHLRKLLESLTQREDNADGHNEYSRLTQAPIIEMKLRKSRFQTSIQSILVQNYAEQMKELIAKRNIEAEREMALLDKIQKSLNATAVMDHILKEENETLDRNSAYRNKYAHVLQNMKRSNVFPIYKSFKSNPAHFSGYLKPNLLMSEHLLISDMPAELFSKMIHNKPVFSERGDVL